MATKAPKKDIVKKLTEETMNFVGMLGANFNAGNKKTLRNWLNSEFKIAKSEGKIEALAEAMQNQQEEK